MSSGAGGDGPPPEPPQLVALFATCIADLADPGPAMATVEVVEAMGMTVELPAGQTCCGQPALNSGYPDEARRLARHWVETFEPYQAVVSPSGSCVATVHHHFPRILRGPWRARAEALATRTFEFSQFVVAYGAGLPLALEATVTVHDSCHMARSLGERKSPRELLGRIRGLVVVEMDDPDTCCGFGGTFAAKFPEVSVAMGDAKLAQADAAVAVLPAGARSARPAAAAAGRPDHASSARPDGARPDEAAARPAPRWLVSADPGCLLHLSSRGAVSGSTVPTRHLAEVVRDALDRPSPSPSPVRRASGRASRRANP
ncbi:MAG: (Fe-S)-binding protein [Acidimicrobiales bacterium]